MRHSELRNRASRQVTATISEMKNLKRRAIFAGRQKRFQFI
jgi:hypothetical protein